MTRSKVAQSLVQASLFSRHYFNFSLYFLRSSARFIRHNMDTYFRTSSLRGALPETPHSYPNAILNHVWQTISIYLRMFEFVSAGTASNVSVLSTGSAKFASSFATCETPINDLFIWSVFIHSDSTLPQATVEKPSRANQFISIDATNSARESPTLSPTSIDVIRAAHS